MIGQASKDENGKYSNGSSGDQTQAEVYTRTWYNRPWNFIIRAKDENVRNKIAIAMENACSNNMIGYDQNQRNTLLTLARNVGYDTSKISKACETDCSALTSVCCMYAGIKESSLYINGNSPTTSVLRSRLVSTGQFTVLTDSKYRTSDKYLLRGDILLYEGHHVAVNLTDGCNSNVSECISTYTKTQFISDIQLAIGVTVDGIAGTNTLNKTVTVSNKINKTHKVILPIQKYLNSIGYDCGATDGYAGNKFDASVRLWQKNILGLNNPDGEFTAKGNSWKKILGII